MLDEESVAFDRNDCWSVRSRDGARTVRLNATPCMRSPMAGHSYFSRIGCLAAGRARHVTGKSHELCDRGLRLVVGSQKMRASRQLGTFGLSLTPTPKPTRRSI